MAIASKNINAEKIQGNLDITTVSASFFTGSFIGSFSGDGSNITGVISSSYADTASLAYTASSADQFNIRTALTASGIIYPTTDGDNGDIVFTDGAGNLSFGRTTVFANVKNISGGTLQKGTPVHVTGSAGNANEIIAASASLSNTMPAHFILNESLDDEEEGLAIAIGFINGVNTSLFMEGDIVYVGANGGYTNVKPTGSNLIQNLGIVTKVAVNGSGYVLGAGRSNDVPNIPDGYFWVGNTNQVATPTPTSSIQNVVSSSYALTASYLDNYVEPFPYTGSAQITGSLGITGSLQISSSGNQQLTLIGSGSSQPIFRVQGSAGELFSITDSLSGSLFAVNNISGLPILEVFSDDRIIQGDYAAPMLTTTVKNTVSAVGAFTVYELPTASYDGAFFEYTARSGSNARAGQIMSIWSGSQVNFTETTTTDFGSTTGLAFTMIVTGSNFALTGSVTTADWTIKTIVRSI